MIEVLRGPTNISADSVSMALTSKNSTLESSVLNPSAPRTLHNPTSFVSIISPSTSVGSQSASSSSTLTNSQSNTNDTLAMQRPTKINETALSNNITTGMAASGTPSWGDTARAIYQFGHDVQVPEKCPDYGKDMDLVIVIMSAPTHIEARTAIRQTWGHYGQRRDVSIVFMLGSTRDKKIEKLLQQEQRLYGDVVRGRYIDSYSNLTLKTISSLEWVSTYCSEVKFMLKTDDDMFINVPRLLSFVYKHARERNVIFGRLAKKWKPIRNKKSKYYVSQAQYKPAVFPDFTTGPAYLLSRDVVNKLYEAALDQTYLKLEDVFTTGIVAHKLGIKRSHANEFLNKRIAYNPCNIQRGISIHMVKYSEQFDLWKKLLDGKSKCK